MPKRTYVLLWAVSLFMLSVAAESVTYPGYMDSAYYYHVAANLAVGRGLVEDFVWNYLQGTPPLPAPANLYWPPMTSFVAAPAMTAFGPTFRSAQLMFVLVSSLVPVMTFWLGWRLLHNGRDALLAAFFTLYAGFYFGYWVAVDSFALYIVFVTPALVALGQIGVVTLAPSRASATKLLPASPSRNGSSPHTHALPSVRPLRALYRSITQSSPAAASSVPLPTPPSIPESGPYAATVWLAFAATAGLFIGAAHLTRADGPLLLAVAALTFARVRPPRLAVGLALSVAAGYLVVTVPWMLRNAGVNAAAPFELAVRAATLSDYNQIFAFANLPNFGGWLASGAGPIIGSRLAALGSNVLDFFGGVYFLAPLAALGLWEARHRAEWRPFLLYAVLLYLTMSLVFAFPGARGSFRHSAAVLLPWLAIAAVAGLRRAVVFGAARLPSWEVERAMQGFGLVLTAGAALLALITFNGHLATWDRSYTNYVESARWLAQQPALEGPVMVTNPPLFTYVTRRPSVVTPSDGLENVLAVADRYGVTLFALEFDHARSLDPLYRGEASHPRLRLIGTAGRTQMFAVLPSPQGNAP